MTQYAEVIYETGDKSIVSYETEEELQAALAEQHNRAMLGLDAGPQEGRPAERVHRVLLYDDHPAGQDPYDKRVEAAVLNKLVEGMTDKEGLVDSEQLYRAMRDEVSPLYPVEQGRHESLFKGQETGELDLAFLNKKSGGK